MDELQIIQSKIYVIRGQRVMLDFDLAMLYEVETRSLNQTVKRNARRFPEDFMFQLTDQEWILISSQFVTTSRMKRPKKSLPYAFTELGALMFVKIMVDFAYNLQNYSFCRRQQKKMMLKETKSGIFIRFVVKNKIFF